jgi:hypothetical protein
MRSENQLYVLQMEWGVNHAATIVEQEKRSRRALVKYKMSKKGINDGKKTKLFQGRCRIKRVNIDYLKTKGTRVQPK